MAYQKLLGQGTRALQVIPSDLCDIPYPGNIMVTSTNSAAVASGPGIANLTDATQDFIAMGVEIGDILYETGGLPQTTGGGLVVEVTNATQLIISRDTAAGALWQPDFSTGVGTPYSIYKKGDYPCMLYFGEYSKFFSYGVETVAGDIISSTYLLPGTMLMSPGDPFPAQVRKLMYTGTGMPWVIAMPTPAGVPYLSGIAVW